jgi:hypothetical protein
VTPEVWQIFKPTAAVRSDGRRKVFTYHGRDGLLHSILSPGKFECNASENIVPVLPEGVVATEVSVVREQSGKVEASLRCHSTRSIGTDYSEEELGEGRQRAVL